MQIQKILLVVSVLLGVASCNQSSSEQSATPPTSGTTTPNDQSSTNNPPKIIDNIVCDVSYPLSIASVHLENSNEAIAVLHDGSKTNASNWQAPNLDSNLIIELSEAALLKAVIITWKSMEYSHLYQVYVSKDKENWQLLNTSTQSEKSALIPDVIDLAPMGTLAETALYVKLVLAGNEYSQASEILEIDLFGCQQDVTHNIELIDWYLSVPTDTDNNGKSDSINESDLSAGYFDPRFFTLSKDGGLIFTTSVSGYKTSTNTKYVRSELREMLRRGVTSHKTQGVNKNNWVFSTAPQSDLNNAGGIDGKLQANLAVNHVTTTGDSYQIGRVIIGQIHANDDEPVRLYYRKLPNNQNGAIYLAHELLDGDDIYYEIIGSRSDNASNPSDGIALNEPFTYTIEVTGHLLNITIVKADGSEFTQNVDMSRSGYDQGGQYMYFKAGVYNQNNSGDQHDYVQATFYQIENHHTGY